MIAVKSPGPLASLFLMALASVASADSTEATDSDLDPGIERADLPERPSLSGPLSVSGDVFGTSISAYVRPVRLRAGPLDDQWTWTFEVEEVGS